MDRREFLKTTSTVIDATLAPGGGPHSHWRMILPIHRNWRYNKS